MRNDYAYLRARVSLVSRTVSHRECAARRVRRLASVQRYGRNATDASALGLDSRAEDGTRRAWVAGMTIFRTEQGWMARDAAFKEAFGTDVVPTAFTADAPVDVVLAELRKRNAAVEVEA